MTRDKVIGVLMRAYEANDELMIDWVDKDMFAVSEKQWSKAVSDMESSKEGMTDMSYVQHVVRSARDTLKTYDVSLDFNSTMVSIEALSEEEAIEQVKQTLYKDPEAYNDLMEGISVGEYVECHKGSDV